MLNKITEKLMPIVDNATAFFGYMQQHQLLLALLSGLTLPFMGSVWETYNIVL